LSVRFVVAFSIFFLEFLGQAISGKDIVVKYKTYLAYLQN